MESCPEAEDGIKVVDDDDWLFEEDWRSLFEVGGVDKSDDKETEATVEEVALFEAEEEEEEEGMDGEVDVIDVVVVVVVVVECVNVVEEDEGDGVWGWEVLEVEGGTALWE